MPVTVQLDQLKTEKRSARDTKTRSTSSNGRVVGHLHGMNANAECICTTSEEYMKKFWWRLRLVYWLVHYNYISWWDLYANWKYTNEDCWQSFREDGYDPQMAILEDLSNA